MKRAKIKKFVIDNRKQIIFALFAFISLIFTKNSDITFMAVPVVAAAGVAAAGAAGGGAAAGGAAAGGAAAAGAAGSGAAAGGAAAGGAAGGAAAGGAAGGAAAGGAKAAGGAATKEAAKKAAIEGAKKGAAKGAVQGAYSGAQNKGEDESTLKAATKGAFKGAAKGAAKGAYGGYSTVKSDLPNKNAIGIRKKTTSASTSMSRKTDKKMPKSTDSASKMKDKTTKKQAKAAKASGREKDVQSAKAENKKELKDIACFGCFVLPTIGFVLSFVLLSNFFISPISDIVSDIECLASENCFGDGVTSFFEKVSNFFAYGEFARNYEIPAKKANETRDKIADKYGVVIDVPLLISTMFSDAVNANGEFDQSTQTYNISPELLKRVDFIDEVAMLQVTDGYIVYKCNSKIVDGKPEYYKDLATEVSEEDAVESECNKSTVGSYIKEKGTVANDLDSYYELLKTKSDLLFKIYGEDSVKEGQIDKLIETIRTSYGIYSLMNGDENNSSGTIPGDLFYDPKINFTAPLKGKYSMTSPFGNRTGIFAGMHKGIDMISNDHNIYAAGDGVVSSTYTESLGGNVITITHTSSTGEQYITQYAHLSKFLVKKGDVVKAGDLIAVMGSTGRTSGTHLHFQVWKKEPYTLYNPQNAFPNLRN